MSTLLLRFIAPMQSWGVHSQFAIRDTGREPSKSGVIGLLCAALGRPRTATLTDLTALKMGVRVDREGILKREFQIARNIRKAQMIRGMKASEISYRDYLCDASFLVGLEGDEGMLEQIQLALRHPRWALFFGRKAFVPAAPIWLPDGMVRSQDLMSALIRYPMLVSRYDNPVRLVIEDPFGEQTRQDVPVSFSERSFSVRRVQTRYVQMPTQI